MVRVVCSKWCDMAHCALLCGFACLAECRRPRARSCYCCNKIDTLWNDVLLAADLISTFRSIAVESTLQSQLVKKFGEEISTLLTNKLVVDYL